MRKYSSFTVAVEMERLSDIKPPVWFGQRAAVLLPTGLPEEEGIAACWGAYRKLFP